SSPPTSTARCFFFQAEDGIRDPLVTGVQTCALPILTGQPAISLPLHQTPDGLPVGVQLVAGYGREDLLIRVASQLEQAAPWHDRSEERRVGREWRRRSTRTDTPKSREENSGDDEAAA